jgi:radical SAM superfamily enzyme YgiQ (UPF0313 family)
MSMLLVSADEGDFQPLGLAGPAAYLRAAGVAVQTLDLTREREKHPEPAEIVAFSVPIFGAIEPTVVKARELRTSGYAGPMVFYNQYAIVQPETFLLDDQCFVIMGEFEEVLVECMSFYAAGKPIADASFIYSRGGARPGKNFKRQRFLPPDRSGLPHLSTYARWDGRTLGNVETMRGCAHPCSYCSVYAAYERSVIKIPEEAIMADIDAVVEMGAEHITFIDADFFSTGKRGHGVVQQMKARHPSLTFDITARLDDVIRHQGMLGSLQQLGCLEMTSAFEFPDESILKILRKGITVDQMRRAISILKETGIRLKPTFITYNPWVNMDTMKDMDRLLKSLGIEEPLDPMQAQTRLLLYKGSPLLKQAEIQNLKLADRGTYYAWTHPDGRVDDAYAELAGAGHDVRMRCCIKG